MFNSPQRDAASAPDFGGGVSGDQLARVMEVYSTRGNALSFHPQKKQLISLVVLRTPVNHSRALSVGPSQCRRVSGIGTSLLGHKRRQT